MITSIFLNIIGIAIFYIFRYENRSTTTEWSRKFWIKENWKELTITLLFDIAGMLLLLHPMSKVDVYVAKALPEGLDLVAKPTVAFALGLYLAFQFYVIVNNWYEKRKKKENGNTR